MQTDLTTRGAVHGILLIDKPSGWTSHDVVAKTRRLTGQRKIGHTGTLDPMATGLLVLCLGDATRLVEYMTGHDKRYQGTIKLGVTTDTDDSEGRVTGQRPIPDIDDLALKRVAGQFTGAIMQRPPSFSALKVHGQRAYAIARRGGNPGVPARKVVLHAVQIERTSRAELSIAVHCGAGTYIRSLARDIGEALGCGAHLSSLRRTAVGRFKVAGATTIDTLQIAGPDSTPEMLAAVDEGVIDWPAAVLSGESSNMFTNGRDLKCARSIAGATTLVRAFNAEGRFIGVGELAAIGTLRPIKVMANLA